MERAASLVGGCVQVNTSLDEPAALRRAGPAQRQLEGQVEPPAPGALVVLVEGEGQVHEVLARLVADVSFGSRLLDTQGVILDLGPAYRLIVTFQDRAMTVVQVEEVSKHYDD